MLHLTPALAVAVAVAALALLNWLAGRGVPFRNDFAAYWPVGRLLLQGQNPYDPAAIAQIQASFGDMLGGDSVVRYPPWSLPLLLPFATLPYAAGWYIWIFLQILLVGGSSVLLWKLFENRDRDRRTALAVGLLFPPSLIMALGGQIGGVLLIACTGFIWAADRHRDVAAGICLGVLTLKPHLFLPLAMIVVLWAAYERRPIVLAAAGLTILSGCLLAVWLRPTIFSEYLQFVRTSAPTGYLPVSAGGLVRLVAGGRSFWSQWIPAAAVLLLIPIAWSRVRQSWDWCSSGAGVLALGVIAAPYGLVHDLVLLIPCLVLIAGRLRYAGDRSLYRGFLWGYAATFAAIWIGQISSGSSFVQVWVAPLVFFICLLVGASHESPAEEPSPEHVVNEAITRG